MAPVTGSATACLLLYSILAGSHSRVQVKWRRAVAHQGSAIFGHGEHARCLRGIPLLNVCDSTSTLPSAWTTTKVLEPTQHWSSGQLLSLPPRSSVFTPALPTRSSWSPCDPCDPWVWGDYVERLHVCGNPLTLRCKDYISGILCPHAMRWWKMPHLIIFTNW